MKLTMPNIIKMISCVIIGLAAWLPEPVGSRALSKRSTDPHLSPCFVLEQEGSTVQINLLESTKDVLLRVKGAHILANDTKDYVSTHLIRDPDVIAYLNTFNFMDAEEMEISMANKAAAIADTTAAFQSFYALLFEHVMYIEHMRTTGAVSQLTGEGSLKEQLLTLERKIYETICAVKITLLGLNANTNNTVTQDMLSPIFLALENNLANEYMRAYIVMRDSDMLMSYLTAMLNVIEQSLSNATA